MIERRSDLVNKPDSVEEPYLAIPIHKLIPYPWGVVHSPTFDNDLISLAQKDNMDILLLGFADYSDDTQQSVINLLYSWARVYAIKQYLTKKHGIPEEKILIFWYGDYAQTKLFGNMEKNRYNNLDINENLFFSSKIMKYYSDKTSEEYKLEGRFTYNRRVELFFVNTEVMPDIVKAMEIDWRYLYSNEIKKEVEEYFEPKNSEPKNFVPDKNFGDSLPKGIYPLPEFNPDAYQKSIGKRENYYKKHISIKNSDQSGL